MKRSFKYGLNVVFMVVLTFLFVTIIMLISYNHHKRYDLTEEKKFTLSQQTVKLLENLNSDVTVKVFYTKDGAFLNNTNKILDEYRYYSKKIKIVPLETNQNPVEARNYNLTNPNSVVVETNDRKDVLIRTDEEALTNALIKVTQKGKKAVYFTTGHGERDFNGNPPTENLALANDSMKKESYDVQQINLQQFESIPDNASAVIIAAPKSDFLPIEVERLKAYINRGGSVMFMFDVWRDNRLLFEYLKELGLQINDDVIIDGASVRKGGNYFTPIVLDYSYSKSPIVQDFGNRMMTVYNLARSIKILPNPPAGVHWEPIAKTSNKESWGEMDKPKAGEKERVIKYDEGKDNEGPLVIGAAGTVELENPQAKKEEEDKKVAEENKSEKKMARLIVFGNVNFASSQSFMMVANRNMFLNSVSWLTEQESLISIRPVNQKGPQPIFMTPDDKRNVMFAAFLILPGVIIILAMVMILRKY